MKKIFFILSLLVLALGSSMGFAGKEPKGSATHNTDFVCMNQCLSSGHMYGYCQRICSY